MKTDLTKINPEEFEFLIEDFLKELGFIIEERVSRGPDRGRDILVSRITTDNIGIINKERFLVECKHNATSNKSVQEADIGNFIAKLSLHKANRYLIACSTILSTTVSNQINAISEDSAYNIKCTSWCKNDIENFLLKFPSIKEKYFGKSQSTSLKDRIKIIANYLQKHHFEAHRGAVLFCSNYTAIFGNDGYMNDENLGVINPIVEKEVNSLRKELKKFNCQEVGFGLSDDGYTWALIVDTNKAKVLNDAIWEHYPKGSSNNEMQYKEAYKRLWTYWHEPFFTDC